MSEKISRETVAAMKDSLANHAGTRWAAYRNEAMDSALHGGLQFLAVGPDNTCTSPPKQYPADTSMGMGWRYLFAGWVNLETGVIALEP